MTKLEHKVVVVKSNGSELEKLLNKDWVIKAAYGTQSSMVVILVKGQ